LAKQIKTPPQRIQIKAWDRMMDHLKEAEVAGSKQVCWKMLGKAVCLRSWMRLHALGSFVKRLQVFWRPHGFIM